MKSDKKKNKSKDTSNEYNNDRKGLDHSDEVKRLNRVMGQVDGIRKMLEAERDLNDILIQFKAVHSALRSIEQRLFIHYVEDCVENIAYAERRKDREALIEDLIDLYKQA